MYAMVWFFFVFEVYFYKGSTVNWSLCGVYSSRVFTVSCVMGRSTNINESEVISVSKHIAQT